MNRPDSSPDMTAELEALQRALGADFVIEGILGSGGFATVYAVRDQRLKRDLAVKVLKAELDSPLYRERFKREAEAVAGLRHAHVLPVFDIGDTGEFTWYSMPLIRGESLRARIARERLDIADARRILEQVSDALAEAHARGIIHRDIKPDNILLDESGNAFLTDFGIAKSLAGELPSLTATGMLMGTPQYMSPEQLAGDAPVDTHADIYSLGIVAYQALTGQLPFEATSLPSLIAKVLSEEPVPVHWRRPECPESLSLAVMKCLEKSPLGRWDDLGQFREALAGRRTTQSEARPSALARSQASQKETSLQSQHLRRVMVGGAVAIAAGVAIDFALGFPIFSIIATLGTAAAVAMSRSAAWVQDAGSTGDSEPGAATVPIKRPAYHSLLDGMKTDRRIAAAILLRTSVAERNRAGDVLRMIDAALTEATSLARRLDSAGAATVRPRLSQAAGPLAARELTRSLDTRTSEQGQYLSALNECADAMRALRLALQERPVSELGDLPDALETSLSSLRGNTPSGVPAVHPTT